MPAPRLDSRSLEQLRSQLRDLAGLYLPAPRWTGVDNLNDPAWRLLSDVFARLLELLIARLNDVPEMHFMRFLDFVRVERSPGSAAAAPVTFLPPKQALLGGDIPAGTRVATAQTERTPALEFESLIETMFTLAADGKTNKKGMPNPFRLAVIARAHFDVVRLPVIPHTVQRIALALGAPAGRAMGYGAMYAPAAGVPAVAAF